MRRAIELSYHCPPAEGAYSVGAVLTDADGQEIATGYSRETDPTVHAEESALAKLGPEDPRLPGATLYSTLEPCSQRASRPRTCSQLILDAKIPRVVIAWREPRLFVENCIGVESLQQHGVHVIELPELADEAKSANTHLDTVSRRSLDRRPLPATPELISAAAPDRSLSASASASLNASHTS